MSMVSLAPSMVEIVKVVDEAPGVKTIYVSPPNFAEPAPGQFNMIYIKGFGEVPVSLSDISLRGSKLVLGHTVRTVGSVTRALLNAAKVGAVIGIRGPYGNGWPLKSSAGKDLLIVAGGIGLAPLRPVIKYVESRRNEFGRLILLYGARTPEDMLYKYELEKYRSIPNSVVKYSIDKPYPGWREYVGFVTDLIDHVDIDPRNTVAFVCGPEIMMKVAARKLVAKGLRKEDIYLSLERRMRCGIGICGTCQLGHLFICRDGPVFSYDVVEEYMQVEGL